MNQVLEVNEMQEVKNIRNTFKATLRDQVTAAPAFMVDLLLLLHVFVSKMMMMMRMIVRTS